MTTVNERERERDRHGFPVSSPTTHDDRQRERERARQTRIPSIVAATHDDEIEREADCRRRQMTTSSTRKRARQTRIPSLVADDT
jgi:hypothetical protein